MADATNPIKQFEIHSIAGIPFGDWKFDFTNSSYFMVTSVILVSLLLSLAMSRRALTPGRAQSMVEMLYEFVTAMIRSMAGDAGLKFFPFVFTLFAFILMGNMLGMLPYFPAPGFHGFTFTSHLIITFALAMSVMAVVIGYGVFRHGFKFFSLFFPSGVPWPLYFLLTPIEIISFLSRPVTLGVRLFANMLAGHILLKVFAGFVVMLGSMGAIGIAAAIAPLAMVVALTALELLVAFLQAYVFAVLTCIYLSDALEPGHH